MSYTLETIQLTISDLNTLAISDTKVMPVWEVLSGLVTQPKVSFEAAEQATLGDLQTLSEQNQKEFTTLLLCCYVAYLKTHHAQQLVAHLKMTKECLRQD